jgi:hypothetical protein
MGEDVAIVVDMNEYRHGRDENMSFTEFLRSAPFPDDFDKYLQRPAEWDKDRDVSFQTSPQGIFRMAPTE